MMIELGYNGRREQSYLSQEYVIQKKNIILQPPEGVPASNKNTYVNLIRPNNTIFPRKEGVGFLPFTKRMHNNLTETLSKAYESSKSTRKVYHFDLNKISTKSKNITKLSFSTTHKKKGKKIYEISRFFVKNYIGALKSTINNPNCEADIMDFIGCTQDHLPTIRQELEKLLRENPKHNRMQLYKLITNSVLNPIFQYFLRRKVFSWIFTSSKMQDRQAHLMARKNFLHLCLKAKELTPYNFRIALNFK
jgi:hypothetical protein